MLSIQGSHGAHILPVIRPDTSPRVYSLVPVVDSLWTPKGDRLKDPGPSFSQSRPTLHMGLTSPQYRAGSSSAESGGVRREWGMGMAGIHGSHTCHGHWRSPEDLEEPNHADQLERAEGLLGERGRDSERAGR